jgi:uncharacterized phosphosugar-binding protein
MTGLTYFEFVMPLLEEAIRTQEGVICQVADHMAQVIANKHFVYVFGAGHAGIIAEEMFYRAGGLVPVIPIFGPGLTPNTHPATLETELERLSGYATLLLDTCGITRDDLLIIHSNSGRNTVAIEMAEEAHKRQITVVALTSLKHTNSVASRHPRGIKLKDVATYVIDNCGIAGDALIKFDTLDQRVGATSTVIGAALANALVVETVKRLLERGIEPPVFRSANLDDYQEHNQHWFDLYRERLSYI